MKLKIGNKTVQDWKARTNTQAETQTNGLLHNKGQKNVAVEHSHWINQIKERE